MKSRFSSFLLSSIFSFGLLSPAVHAADSPEPKSEELSAPSKPEQPDIFDFQGSGPSEVNTESELVLDERIRVKVEPVVRNAVVERVVEAARIRVKTPHRDFSEWTFTSNLWMRHSAENR
jgi:hypothetical protein